MSISFFLRCNATKKAVHVAQQSSRSFRGADPHVVAAFAVAHEGKVLDVVDADHFDEFMGFDVWTTENCSAQYTALVGHPLVGL